MERNIIKMREKLRRRKSVYMRKSKPTNSIIQHEAGSDWEIDVKQPHCN